MKLRWTTGARQDLKEIGRYIARDNRHAARRWVEHLQRRAQQAAEAPRSGRVVPEIERDNIRKLIEGNYRIVYLIRPNSVDVLAVREGHRRLTLP